MITVYGWSKVSKEVRFLANACRFDISPMRYDEEVRLLAWNALYCYGYPKPDEEFFIKSLKKLFNEKWVKYEES